MVQDGEWHLGLSRLFRNKFSRQNALCVCFSTLHSCHPWFNYSYRCEFEGI